MSATVIRVRYWAAARAAAGVDGDEVETTTPLSLTDLRATLATRRPGRLEAVLASCSVLLGDLPVGSRDPDDVQVDPGSTVEFLPPFAGG